MSLSFLDVAELSEQQLQRQLDIALKVRHMTSDERGQWLQEGWDRMQRQSNALFAGLRPVQAGATAFESLAHKNAHDDDRMIGYALALRRATR